MAAACAMLGGFDEGRAGVPDGKFYAGLSTAAKLTKFAGHHAAPAVRHISSDERALVEGAARTIKVLKLVVVAGGGAWFAREVVPIVRGRRRSGAGADGVDGGPSPVSTTETSAEDTEIGTPGQDPVAEATDRPVVDDADVDIEEPGETNPGGDTRGGEVP